MKTPSSTIPKLLWPRDAPARSMLSPVFPLTFYTLKLALEVFPSALEGEEMFLRQAACHPPPLNFERFVFLKYQTE